MTYADPVQPYRIKPLVGRSFGRLVVLRLLGRKEGRTYWRCRCECGNERDVEGGKLRAGQTRSCGCLMREFAARVNLKHGESRHGRLTAEYKAWVGAKERCFSPRNIAFPDYGGRGITMCSRWAESYEAFLADVGRKPTPAHSLDRINNDGNYEPSNCRWATRKVQANNRRQNIVYRVGGAEGRLKQLCEHFRQNYKVAHARRRLGWPIDQAVLTGVA